MELETFDLPDWSPPVPVALTHDISREQLLNFPAFKTWMASLRRNLQLQREDETHPFHQKPYALKSIKILSVTFFGGNDKTKKEPKGFIQFEATIKNEAGLSLPGITFLRGGSVAMLMILKPHDDPEERWVIMTVQARVPAGSLSFWEIPAGMLDRHGTSTAAAAHEIREETGLEVKETDLTNLTEEALKITDITEMLQPAMYPSPGGSDEYIPIFLWEKTVDRLHIDGLRDKLTGLRMQGEMITLKLVPYERLWQEGARDGKTLAAWALYEGLKREGKIP